jgi:hypothetical protein
VSSKRLVIAITAVAAIAGGAVGAVAATRSDDAKKAEDSILAYAAKRLNVSPDALRDALAAAEDAQLDEAVKDGLLTQKQADEIKAHRKREGSVLGGPPIGRGGFPGPGRHMFRHFLGPHEEILGTVAKALGMSRNDLFKQMRSGKSLAKIAKARGKSLSGVEKAVKAEIAKQLDRDVKAGRLTDKQRDDMLKHFKLRLGHLGEFGLRHFGPRPRRMHGFRHVPPPFPPPGDPAPRRDGSAPEPAPYPSEPGTSAEPAPYPMPPV